MGGVRVVTATMGVMALSLLSLPERARSAPGRGWTETEARVQAVQAPDIVMYSRYDCPHCARARQYLDDLARRRPDLTIEIRDLLREPDAADELIALARERGITQLGVPAFHIGDELIVGFQDAETTGRLIEGLLVHEPGTAGGADPAMERPVVEAPVFGRLDANRLGLPIFTFLIGLVDGFNPCAMWALLYLLSLLVNLQDRVRMFAVAGTFVLVGGLVYFAFIAAWLEVFLFVGVSRTIQVLLGGVAIAIGAVNMKDFVAFKKGISLSIPESAKPGIYARMRRVLTAENLAGAVLAVAILAGLINLVELLCTAGLPAVYTEILASRELSRAGYYGYLGLYILAYILDDSLVLGVAVVTLSRHRLQETGGRWLKLLSGAVMLVLGLGLILRPGWLF